MAPIDPQFPMIPPDTATSTGHDIEGWGLTVMVVLVTGLALVTLLFGTLKLRGWGKWRIARPLDASKPYREQHWVQTWHGWVSAESKSGSALLRWKGVLNPACNWIRYTVLGRPDPIKTDERFDRAMSDPDVVSLNQILLALDIDRTIRPSWLAAQMRGWDPLPDRGAESVRLAVSIEGETVEDRTLVIRKRRCPASRRYRLDGTYDSDSRSWRRSVSLEVPHDAQFRTNDAIRDHPARPGTADHASAKCHLSRRLEGLRTAKKLLADHKKRGASDRYATSRLIALRVDDQTHRCTSLATDVPKRLAHHNEATGDRRDRPLSSQGFAGGDGGMASRVRRSRARTVSCSTQCTVSSRAGSDVRFPPLVHHRPAAADLLQFSRPDWPELYLDGGAHPRPIDSVASCMGTSPSGSLSLILAQEGTLEKGNSAVTVPRPASDGVLTADHRITSTSLAETWHTARSSVSQALEVVSNHTDDSWTMHGALPWSGRRSWSGNSARFEYDDPGTGRTAVAASDTSERTIIRTAGRSMSLLAGTEGWCMDAAFDELVPGTGHAARGESSRECRVGEDAEGWSGGVHRTRVRRETASDMTVETTLIERISRTDSQKRRIAELWRRRTIHIDRVQRKRNMGYARFAGFDI